MKTLAEERNIKFNRNLPVQAELMKIVHEDAHYHPDVIEVLVCLEGEVTIKVCNEDKVLRKGDTYAMDFSDIHCLYSDTDNIVLILHINGRTSGNIYNELRQCFLEFDTTNLNEMQRKPSYEIQDLMLAITQLLFINDEKNDKTVHTMAESMIRLFINYFDWLSFIPDPYYSNRQFHERCKRIMNYCLENYTQKITISQVAEMEHINENYLSAFMKKSSMGGFKANLNFIRCFFAEQLLLTTDLDVINISSQCGFSDPKYFYSAFRKAWGCTPAKHRKWYQDYEKNPRNVVAIDSDAALDIINSYLPSYHLRKVKSLSY